MRKTLTMLSLAAITLSLPGLAEARSACEQSAHNRRVAGTVIGAVGGALIGNAISHKGGALVGGVGGAVVGNQLARRKCGGAYASRRTTTYRGYRNEEAPMRCSLHDVAYYDASGRYVTRRVNTCS